MDRLITELTKLGVRYWINKKFLQIDVNNISISKIKKVFKLCYKYGGLAEFGNAPGC